MKATAALATLALVASATTASLGAGLTAGASAAPAASERAAAWRVTATINKDQVVAKTVVKVKGRVKPAAAGQKVLLQQRLGTKKRWKQTGTAKVRRNGTYVLKDRPSTPGERDYRVVMPASNGRAKGVSKPVSTTVYAWRKLNYQDMGARSNAVVAFGNVATERAYPIVTLAEGQTSGFAEFTLGRKCLAMKTDWAMTDASASGSIGWIGLEADEQLVSAQDLLVGAPIVSSEIDLTDVYRIRFSMTSTVPGGYPGAIEPTLLCS